MTLLNGPTMKRQVCLLSFALLFALATRADTVTITATLTDGAESVSGSVNWDTATNTFVVGSDKISAQGPLGAFTLLSVIPGILVPPCTGPSTCALPTVNWVDAEGDVFQIDPGNEALGVEPPVFPTLGNYNPALIDLTCSTFGNPCFLLGGGGFFPGNVNGTLTVTATPEPTTYILLGVGLMGLIMMMEKRNSLGHQPAS
jgi:hypothetical protein